MLEADNIGLCRGGRWLLRGVTWRAGAGEFWAVLGPNGAGKSTLLKLLAGECPPSEGTVHLDGHPVAAQDPQALARQRGVLLQSAPAPFPFLAWDVVMMGRMPHAPRGAERAQDRVAALHAMERTTTTALQHRVYPTLSGGERQRVDLARVLAQETPVLLLDEPVSHLDPLHQCQVLALCEELAAQGHLVVAVLHDLNLAAQFAGRVLLLKEGQQVAAGTATEVLTPNTVEAVYGLRCERVHRHDGAPVLLPLRRENGFANPQQSNTGGTHVCHTD